MKNPKFILVPTINLTEDIEEGKFTTIHTNVGEIQIFKPLEEVMAEIKECKDKGELFRYKKLDEYSATLQIFGEFVLDLENTIILGYKEVHIIDNLKLQRELTEKKAKEEVEKENIENKS